LIEDLSNPDADERVSGALALGNMAAGGKRDVERAKPAVPALARAMKDKNKEVRESAAFALGNIRADPGTSVLALMEGLKDKDPSVRKRSAESLGGFGRDAQPAVPALVEALGDQDDDVQRQAAEAIGQIGGNAWTLIPALLNAFKNSNNSQAADVLADIARKAAEVHADIWRDASSAVSTLVEILQERDGERRVVIQSNAIAQYSRSAKAAEVLGAIGPEAGAAVPALVDALKDRDPYIAARAAGALGRIGQKQDEAARVAVRIVSDETNEEEHWWDRTAAAEALGQLGPDAEFALPALSKVVDHPVDPSGFSARAADAILSIAATLRDSHRTTAVPVLKVCEAAMEKSVNGYVRTKALDLSEAITALEAMRRSNPIDLLVDGVHEHPWIAVVLGIYASAAVLWIGLLWLWPIAIFRIGQLVRPLPKVKLPGWLGGIEVSFAHLILVGFLQNRDRILDAWVAKNADVARARFEEIETVRRICSSPLGGVILDGVTTETLRPADLRPAFTRSKTCVLIHGDHGTGKTRLACEIARWGMAVDRSDRLRKNLMLPVLLQENFTYTAEKNVSLFTDIVSEKLQILDLEPPPEEFLLQLLRGKRLLVIVDGLSELNEETRNIIRPAGPDFPALALLVTSRKEEAMGGMRRTMIKTYATSAAETLTPAEAIEDR
jgi:HEAT repeat protein